MIAALVLGALLAVTGPAAAAGPVAAAPAEPLAAALHVHSDLSSGEFPLEALADMAEKQELGALLLAENHRLRVEYGFPPFRALTRLTQERRAIVDLGVERYLERVAAVRQRFPRLLVLPGLELVPHYQWTGSLASGLTLHHVQKNILVFGVTDPRQLAAWPATGSRSGGFGLQSVLDALPALLVVPGLALLLRKRARRIRIGHAFVIVRSRRWGLGAVLTAIGLTALVRGWPFTVDAYPYWAEAGLAPHQELIEQVRRAGGVSIWSFPEARDQGERNLGPVRVRWRTEPYGDDLLRTHGYTAFGAVYEDTTTFERPGGGWDRLLSQYVLRQRREPVWGVAEAGFHGPEAGKRLGGVQTVFLVRERPEAAVLDALRTGRMYARRHWPAAALTLTEFSVRAGETTVGLGQTVSAPAGTPLEVTIAIAAASGAAQPVRVVLVKRGTVVGGWAGTTPFRATHHEIADGAPTYFRADATSGGAARVLTNPIFVR